MRQNLRDQISRLAGPARRMAVVLGSIFLNEATIGMIALAHGIAQWDRFWIVIGAVLVGSHVLDTVLAPRTRA